MGIRKATFESGGQISQHAQPGGYSRLNFVKGSGGLSSSSNVVIAGDCRGGDPNKLLWFGSPSEAAEVLRSGPLLDAVRHAFSPGPGLTPQAIAAWRVNPGTRATRTHLKTAVNMITVSGWDYGLHTNQLKSKLTAGTTVGKKLTVKFQNNDEVVTDNIYRASFEILYIGTGSACAMEITKTGLTTVCTGSTPDNLAIVFASFPTIEDLVNYINDQATYTCTIKTGVPTQKTIELDSVTGQAIKTVAYTAQSTLQAIIDAYKVMPYVGNAVYNSAATTRDVPDVDADFVYFSGAVDGAYTASEWAVSLPLLKLEDVQFIGTSSEESATHALIRAHVEECNAVTGKAERQMIVGGAAGETTAQALVRSAAIGVDSGMLAYPGFTDYDFDDMNQTKTWSPAYHAAKLLGAISVLSIPEPLTNKVLNVLGWEVKLSSTEIDALITGGVCAGIKDRSGRFVCARSVTTWQGDELQRCEFSMMRIALYVSRDLRSSVEQSFVGKTLNNSNIGKIDGVVIGKLSQYFDLGLFNGKPSYWGYRKVINGDQVNIDYDANLTPPLNFMFVTSHMHVYASTASAAA